MKIFILPLAVFFAFPSFAQKAKSSFELNPELKARYLSLLEQAADFHKIMAQSGSKQEIQREIKETQEIIAKLDREILSVSRFHHRIHSHKLLNSIEERLAALKLNKGAEGDKKNIKKLFNSFFELAQVYDLTKDMKDKVFYCARDKSLWFQESGKAQNPISPGYKNCGRRIL